MSALDRTPENLNYISNHNFRFLVKKLPHVNFFCQEVVIPSFSGGEIRHGTPFATINTTGDRIQWSPLNVTFKVDEDLTNYTEIYDWLMAINYPDEFAQYKNIADIPLYTGDGLFSDGYVMVQTNIKNFNKSFVFRRMFPIALSELALTSKNNVVEYISATVTFSYLAFYIESN
jgi:hypothetical protein